MHAYCDISRRGRLCVLIVTSVGGADCACLL